MTRRARILTALASAGAIVAAVLVAGPGYHTSQVRMHSGAVWLASAGTGQATLVDGATAEVKTRVPVASPGSPLAMSQQGNAAHVLNRATGELRRVDSATEQVSSPVRILPAGGEITMIGTPRTIYGVDAGTGTVTSVDPDTLATRGEPKPLADRIIPESLAADGRDRLWAIDQGTGDLVWLTGDERRTRPAATRPGTSRLVITRDQPVLVDPQRGTAELLDPESGAVVRSVRLDLRRDDVVTVSGSSDRSRVLIATGGALTTCDFGTGSCTAPVIVSSSGGDLGAPVEIHDHAVIPDYSSGQATIVDLATSQVVARHRLFDGPTRFELFTRDGIVFFNDPNSNRAGVLDVAGDVEAITKYTEGSLEKDGTSAERPTPGDQAVKVGSKPQKPGLSVPGQTNRPARTDLAPPPAASIVVKPGNRGVVGDLFELTMVYPRSAGNVTAQWTFGEDSVAVGTTVRHRWNEPGTYTVRADATLAGVQLASAETTVTIEPAGAPPGITRLNVQRPRPVIGETVRFSADSTGNPTRWDWSISGPGRPTPETVARTPEFQYAFAAPGTYTVALTVTAGEQTAQSSRQFTVVRGTVRSWGMPDDTVVPPSAESGVIAIAAGSWHSLALKADGSVVAWGNNWHGQLDVPASARSGVIAIAAGGDDSLALKADGSVVAWGDGPVVRYQTAETKSGVVAIAAGYSHGMALKNDGTVIAWGDDNYGQVPVPPAAKSGVIAIAAGSMHSMALKQDGSVIAWGDPVDGVCNVPPEASGVVAISAGQGYSVALRNDGSVIAWGAVYMDAQTAVPPGAKSGVVAISAGSDHVLALKTDGTAIAWGGGMWGESEIPPEYNHGVLAVAAGGGQSILLVEGID